MKFYVRPCIPSDLPAVQALMQSYGTFSVEASVINHRDVALTARDSEGACIGFIWCGLMSKNKLGYIDKFIVSPSWKHKGVGHALAQALLDELKKRKVDSVFGIIKRDPHHDSSALNALKMAMKADMQPYTYVHTTIQSTLSELETLKHGS